MIKASAGHEGGELTVELDDYLHVLRKSWVLILVTSLLSLGAAADKMDRDALHTL